MRIPSTLLAATLFFAFGSGSFAPVPASASEAAASESYNLVIGGMT